MRDTSPKCSMRLKVHFDADALTTVYDAYQSKGYIPSYTKKPSNPVEVLKAIYYAMQKENSDLAVASGMYPSVYDDIFMS